MSDRISVHITKETLRVANCYEHVSHVSAGGHAMFIGTVRNQTKGNEVLKLEFEAYTPMAIKELEKIAQTVIEKWDAIKVSIHHRVGTLRVGDIAVIISVSTPHRAASFEACQYAIDTLKETVPIWKKEIFRDGEVWVSAHP